jgi:dTDP-4-dehydrorhamnose reductase
MGQRIIIIGASGMIGTELVKQAQDAGCYVIGTYATRPIEGFRQFDVTKQGLLDAVPDLGPDDSVVMLSAILDQTWVEQNQEEAFRVNAVGPMLCAAVAAKRQAHFIFMSTEAVLWKRLTVYGVQKAMVEDYLRAHTHTDRSCIARTGSVTGWREQDRSCTISKTYDALLAPGAKMAPDNFFTLTDVFDVARGLLQVSQRHFTGLVHLAAGPKKSRTELADLIIAESKFGSQMAYEETSRPQQFWLSSDFRALGMRFTAPIDVVRRKVAQLDSYVAKQREALLDHHPHI